MPTPYLIKAKQSSLIERNELNETFITHQDVEMIAKPDIRYDLGPIERSERTI